MKTFRDMTPARLQEIVERFPRLRIAVIGDFFLDKYLDIDPSLAEVSLETGKSVHQVVGIRHSPGAAGTVVCNLAALGTGTLHAIGFTGDDGESFELRKDLAALHCGTRAPDLRPAAAYAHLFETARQGRPEPGRRTQPLRYEESLPDAPTTCSSRWSVRSTRSCRTWTP